MPDTPLLRLAANIVAAYLAHNAVPADAVPELIRAVYAALGAAGALAAAVVTLEPAVPVKKSVFPGYIVCLEDGKKLKMLKRHLQTSYGLTPGQYRTKWSLPADYPMVAPDYAARRSTLAKSLGLGRKPIAAPAITEVAVQKIPAGKRRKAAGARKTKPAEVEVTVG